MKAMLHVVGLAVGMLAILLILVSMATTRWLKYRSQYGLGLFVGCHGTTCESYDPTSAQAATRFFVVFGFLTCFGSVVVAIAYYVRFVKNDVENKLLPLVSAILFFVAGGCCIVGAIIWAAKVRPDYNKVFDLGYSFALDIVGALFAFAAGALVFVQRTRPINV